MALFTFQKLKLTSNLDKSNVSKDDTFEPTMDVFTKQTLQYLWRKVREEMTFRTSFIPSNLSTSSSYK